MSLKNTVIEMITRSVAGLPRPQGNADPLLQDAFVWDEIERLAKGKSKDAWDALAKNGIYDPERFDYSKGEHNLFTGNGFVAGVKATDPVKRFDADECAKLIARRFKCPKHVALELIEKAKVPGKPNRSYSVQER